MVSITYGHGQKWTEEEDLHLTKHFPHVSHKQIAQELNRTPQATRHHAYVLKLRKNPYPLKKLNDYSRGFLEAAIDGEGTLGLYKEKTCRSTRGFTWKVRCQISNNNKEWLEKIRMLTEAGYINNGIDHKNPLHRPSYCLFFRVAEIRQLLPQIHLVVKGERQKIALETLPMLNHDISKNFDYELEQLYQKQIGGMAK